ncbi:hypothetical protein BDQ17DRAFT_1543856 [Cyathus striatus]|nr:hypothetical protein BDQ17DRAFT_1543856 [Cyathus striatus]
MPQLPKFGVYFPEGMHFHSDYSEPEAMTSPGLPPSSPLPINPVLQDEHLLALNPSSDLLEVDPNDKDFEVKKERLPATTLDQKILGTISHMQNMYSRLSLAEFLIGLFKSEDHSLKATAGMFYAENSHIKMMERWWNHYGGQKNNAMVDWIMEKATAICAHESNNLTYRASIGPHSQKAEELCLPVAKINVENVNKFQIKCLGALYDEITPHFQKLVKAFITPLSENDLGKNRDFVSALLVILPTPTGQNAKTITAIPPFKEKAGTWHKINSRIALTNIIPSKSDHATFRKNSILHVQNIIVDNLENLNYLQKFIPKFEDPKAIQPVKTEEYYLPTFD